jgi:hypothetical protein
MPSVKMKKKQREDKKQSETTILTKESLFSVPQAYFYTNLFIVS